MGKKNWFIILTMMMFIVAGTYLFWSNSLPEQEDLLIGEEGEELASIVINDEADRIDEKDLIIEPKEQVPEEAVQDIEVVKNTSREDIKSAEKAVQVSREQPQASKDFNSYVLEAIKTYDFENNKFPYLLNNDFANYNGVTTDLIYQGQTLAKAHSSGNRASHCVGITFEIFFKAMQARNRDLGQTGDQFNNLEYKQLKEFMLTWYVAHSPKSENNLAVALEKYGLGQRIYKLENARAGDFMDFDRSNGTAHAVVFLNWIRDEQQSIIGLKYWSSQESTGGIAYKEEYFGNVLQDSLYIGRGTS